MLDLMKWASEVLEHYLMRPVPWTIIGIAVWALTIWAAVSTEPAYKRTEVAMISSILGAFVGAFSVPLLVILPFVLPLFAAVVLLGLIGVAGVWIFRGKE